MAGRGFVHEVEPIVNDRIKVLRAGRWQEMYVPVNGDRRTAGISLAESFADAYAKEHNYKNPGYWAAMILNSRKKKGNKK